MEKHSRDQLLYSFRRVLRPLIRILIRSGVRYDEFLDLVKGVYVESAVRDGLGDGQKPTRAKVSVSTGVPRRDVDRFIDNDGALPAAPRTLTRTLAEILNAWHTDPQFVGPYGIPLELEIGGQRGRTFGDLVKKIDETADSSAALDELLRLQAVVWSGTTHVRAVSRAFIPIEAMSPAQLEFFGNALTRLSETLQFNLDRSKTVKRLERSVQSDKGLPVEVVPVFEKHVRERVTELLTDLDNWLSPYSAQLKAGQEVQKVGLAVFQFVDKEPECTALSECVAADK